MHYRGQIFRLDVTVPPMLEQADLVRVAAEFHRRHLERYEHANEEGFVEISGVRLTVLGEVSVPSLRAPSAADTRARAQRTREVLLGSGGRRDVDVFLESALGPGVTLEGPCLVDGEATTILVPEGSRATCLADGTLLIELDEEDRTWTP
jgi:N-methylhydantoinase A